jgi:hypothetical protein
MHHRGRETGLTRDLAERRIDDALPREQRERRVQQTGALLRPAPAAGRTAGPAPSGRALCACVVAAPRLRRLLSLIRTRYRFCCHDHEFDERWNMSYINLHVN